jgi:hypothetical protein
MKLAPPAKKKVPAKRAAKRDDYNDAIAAASACVPTSWLDPLLTGPEKVIGDKPDCRAIEALLRGVQDRIRALRREAKP